MGCSQELIEIVIDFLYDDQETLRKFSLTSRSCVPSCQKHLFAEITWTSNKDARRFDILAKSSPHLLPYVESFSFLAEHYPDRQSMATISHFPTLKQLELDFPSK